MDELEAARLAGRSPSLGTSLGTSFSGTNLERAGDYNQRVILQAIRVHGPVTRVELAALTGLTAPAIANIIKRLMADGLVLDAGRTRGGRGQPAYRFAVDPDGCFSLGLNLDRDHLTLLAMDLLGQVRARASREVSFALPDEVQAFFAEAVASIRSRSPAVLERLIGVGVAMPDDLGRVHLAHQPDAYEVWRGVDVRRLVGEVLPAAVFIENDAAAAAIGELQFGLGLENPNFFYILLSEGLGGGLVVEGTYFRGETGRSGEIGFMPVRGADGRPRALQDVVSLSALYDHLSARGITAASPLAVAALDARGRAAVADWIDQAADALVGPLTAVNCLINPGAVFLGGRLPGEWLSRLAAELNARLAAAPLQIPAVAPVQATGMAADAPAVGAAILPFLRRLLPSQEALMKTLRQAAAE